MISIATAIANDEDRFCCFQSNRRPQPEPDRGRPPDLQGREQVDQTPSRTTYTHSGCSTAFQDKIRITPEVGRKLNGEKSFVFEASTN